MWEHKVCRGLRGICVFAAAALLLCGCGQGEELSDLVVIEKEEDGLAYKFTVAEIGDVTQTTRVQCTYRQVGEEEICFQLGGKLVDKVYVENGDSVKKGQLLVELSSRDLERSIEDLKYQIARNELLLGYVDENENIAISGYWVSFLNGGWMSEEQLQSQIAAQQQRSRYDREDITDNLTADRAKLKELEQQFRNSRIYAPVDGVVYDMDSNLDGSTSKLGEVVMRVLDTSESIFETSFPEALDYFAEGDMVSMAISYGSAAGEYVLVPWHMEEWGEKQLFEVYEAPEDTTLEVGVTGSIQLVTESRENVLRVPPGALFNAEDRIYVYVLGDDNMPEVRWVETGLYGEGMVEILSGLTEGERVILK